MDIVWATILGAIIGAVIVMVGTLLVSKEQMKRDDAREQRRLAADQARQVRDEQERVVAFTRLLLLETRAVIDVVDQLTTEASRDNFIAFAHLNRMVLTRAGVDRNRDWIVVLPSPTREAVFSWYMDLAAATLEANGVETFAGNLMVQGQDPTANAWVTGERRRLIAAFQALSGRGRELLHQLS